MIPQCDISCRSRFVINFNQILRVKRNTEIDRRHNVQFGRWYIHRWLFHTEYFIQPVLFDLHLLLIRHKINWRFHIRKIMFSKLHISLTRNRWCRWDLMKIRWNFNFVSFTIWPYYLKHHPNEARAYITPRYCWDYSQDKLKHNTNYTIHSTGSLAIYVMYKNTYVCCAYKMMSDMIHGRFENSSKKIILVSTFGYNAVNVKNPFSQ